MSNTHYLVQKNKDGLKLYLQHDNILKTSIQLQKDF